MHYLSILYVTVERIVSLLRSEFYKTLEKFRNLDFGFNSAFFFFLKIYHRLSMLFLNTIIVLDFVSTNNGLSVYERVILFARFVHNKFDYAIRDGVEPFFFTFHA